MPFAHGVGRIPGRAQNLGYRHAAVVQVSAIPLFAVLFFGHVPDAGLVGMQAGQQACPGGTAPGRVIELGAAQPVCCEAVEIGRTYQTSVAADVGIPMSSARMTRMLGCSGLLRAPHRAAARGRSIGSVFHRRCFGRFAIAR